jgi:hypothetical protein
VSLHYDVRVRYQGSGGVDEELEEGRRDVGRVEREMDALGAVR